jgi:molecular chaperone IbpA|tara:strand:+ start:1004 stop:1447 length:444 start_codon:yes stop_codon:yes gene_type:complete
MTNKALSIFNQLRPVTVGFDSVFDNFERMFDHDFDTIKVSSFPFYNIVKTDKNKYDVEMALAGYGKDDIIVSLEESVLTIKSKPYNDDKDKDTEYEHKGISKRFFTKSFTVADDVEVKGAELKDGLLKVSLERIVPKEKQARTIKVK